MVAVPHLLSWLVSREVLIPILHGIRQVSIYIPLNIYPSFIQKGV